jgi:glucose dehydrogenase
MKVFPVTRICSALVPVASALVLVLASACPAQKSSAQHKVGQGNVDWTAYNGGIDGDHYSPLTQIHRGNVKHLSQAWVFDTGEKGGIQTNPLIIGGTLYAFTPTQKVIALDAATGQLKWKFDSGVGGTQPARGLAWWTAAGESRLFAGIMNYLYCFDPATGKPILSFGEDGRIDLRKGLREPWQEQSIVLTTPGIIYKDLIIVGGRNPETHRAPPGDVRAYDVRTGKMVWIFHTIPRPGEPGYETWPADAWKTAGAANNWAGMTLDATRGMLFVPTGSAVFDFYGGDRVGNDHYADCEVALDAATGKRLWHFQGVHHDIWDRDFSSPPALIALRRGGKTVDALAQTSKQGHIYIFERESGKPLNPITERPYPASTVPGEVASATQPLPESPEPFARQRLTADMLTERTPEAHAWAVKEFQTLRSDGQFLPFAVGSQTVVFPGFDGGGEWGGPAVDPRTNILYVNANEMAWTGGLIPAKRSGSAGELVYQSQCAMCHGTERAGNPPAFPSLVDVSKRLDPNKISDTVEHGKGRMPSFPNIDDIRLAALLDFLRTDSSASNSSESNKELTPVAAAKIASQATSQATSSAPGAAVYRQRCAACHGQQQQGVPPSMPMLLGVGNRLSVAQVDDIIHKGKGKMPGKPDFVGPDLDALLVYLGVDDHATHGSQDEEPADAYTFTGYRKFLDPDGYPAIAPPWGTLNAIDLTTGKYVWKIPLGEFPELGKNGLRNTGSENYGGPIVTAGGVLFIGATIYDHKFRAYDSRTGNLLWESQLPYSGVATPATYMVGGRQFVVIAASGARDAKGPQGGAYVAFALPR